MSVSIQVEGEQNIDLRMHEAITNEHIHELINKGWIAIFTDAAFRQNQACLAGLAKDKSAHFLAWCKKDQAQSPLDAEAKALLLAPTQAASSSFKNVVTWVLFTL